MHAMLRLYDFCEVGRDGSNRCLPKFLFLVLVCVGGNAHLSSSYKGRASVGRINAQSRSPGRNAFESAEDSDEEGSHLADDNRGSYVRNIFHSIC